MTYSLLAAQIRNLIRIRLTYSLSKQSGK